MYGNLEGGEAEMYPEGAELPENNRLGEEGARPGIGARIVAIPAELDRLSMIRPPAPSQEAAAPPPDFQRLVDVQRQQQMLGELTRPMGRPPILQQPAASNVSGQLPTAAGATPTHAAGTGRPASSANGPGRPGQPVTTVNAPGRPPATTRPSGKAPPQSGRGGPAPSSARGPSKPQGMGGKTPQSEPGFLERSKNYLHDFEQKVEDSVSTGWHSLLGDEQGSTRGPSRSTAQNSQGAQKLPTDREFREGQKANAQVIEHEQGPQWKGPAKPVSEGGNILKPAPGKSLIESYQNYAYRNDSNNTECVTFIQKATGAPPTKTWKQGQKIRKGDNSIPVGAVIATFVDEHYSTLGRRNQHAAIYLGQDENGIRVLNQHNKTGKVVVDVIPWKPKAGAGLSNDGNAFSVVKW